MEIDNAKVVKHMAEKRALSKSSVEQYQYRITRLQKMNVDIYGLEQEIIDKVLAIDGLTYHIFHGLLTAANCYRKAANEVYQLDPPLPLKDITKISSDKGYFDKLRDRPNVQKQEERRVEVPDQEELLRFIEQCYKEKDYVRYLINHLILTMGIRNMDLNCMLTSDPSEVTAEDNWLLLKEDEVYLIRNRYKTVKHYGQKVSILNDARVVKAVESLISKGQKHLLETKGSRIKDSSLSAFIRTRTYKGLGQRKIVHGEFTDKADEFYDYCKSRGTDPVTAINDYCVNLRIEKGMI